MSIALDMNLSGDVAMESLLGRLDLSKGLPQGLKEEVGASERDLVARHFESLPANKRGWPTTGFFKRAARATNFATTPDGAMVSVPEPIGLRQRYLGGTIAARNVKNLALPANAETYGKTPREFSNLKLMFFKKAGELRAYLAETASSQVAIGRKPNKAGKRSVTWTGSTLGGRPMFWLKPSVNQQADPTILPSREEMAVTALKAIKTFVLIGGGR